MLTATQKAIGAILETDPSLTDETRDAWRKAMRNGEPPRTDTPLLRVVDNDEAKELLGVSKQTLYRYARNGLLVRVKSSGGKRSRGYSMESVQALLDGRAAK